MGSRRTRDQAGLLAATTAMNKRVKELTESLVRRAGTLKNMKRAVFHNSAAMRGTQAYQAFRDRTAAPSVAEMDEAGEHARVRQEKVAAERARDAAKSRRVQVIAEAVAEALARRATAQAARLDARPASAAAATCSAAGTRGGDDDFSSTDEDGPPRLPRLPAFAAAGAHSSRSSGARRGGGRWRAWGEWWWAQGGGWRPRGEFCRPQGERWRPGGAWWRQRGGLWRVPAGRNRRW